MSFLFGKKPRAPAELVKATKEALVKLDGTDAKKNAAAVDEISKNLQAMKVILYGEGDVEPVAEMVAQLAQEVYNSDLLQMLIPRLGKIDFESRKDTALIFGNLLRRQIGTRSPTVDYLCSHDQILSDLIRGYENPDVALNAGIMLRECSKHESLTKIILNSENFYRFFDYVELSTFDVASDAFTTFRELLTKHKALAAEVLEANYDKIIPKYTGLLNSDNYVTKRQSLKLLGELLLDRTNFNVMTVYISNPDNLKLMMNLLRDGSRNIQFEAFHVFKVFVANPNKAKPILDILIKNREKLVTFLSAFHNDRQDDEQFNEEKTFLLKQIQDL